MTEEKTDKSRTARCACQNFTVELAGDPQLVGACNCFECQRRTGSAFGVGAFFEKSQLIKTSGDKSTYNRQSESGRALSLHFCPNCGTTLYWDLEMLPGKFGVAVGCFNDPNFPAPTVAVWCQSAHDWVEFPDTIKTFAQSAVKR